MARFAKFGQKKEEKILSTGRLPSITRAYTKPETNKKVDVPQSVSRQIVNAAAEVLRKRLAEEIGKGGIQINLKEARVIEQSDRKEVRKASLGFEVEVNTMTGRKSFSALVEYDTSQTRSKQFMVMPSILLGETKAAFKREEIERFLSEKKEFKKVAVYWDPDIKRYRCLGEATDEFMDKVRNDGHYVRARYVDSTIIKGHESEGFEVIPLDDSLPDMRKLADKWEDRASEKHPNVSDAELLPSLPTPTTKDWDERASEKGQKISDTNMLKMEQKTEEDGDEEELEEDVEEAEEAEDVAEEAIEDEVIEEAGEAIETEEELIEEAPVEEIAVTPAEDIIEQAAEEVKTVLEDAAAEIKEEAVEEIREEVTEEVEQEVKQKVQQEVMEAIEEAVGGTPAVEEAIEEVVEGPVEEEALTDEEIFAKKKDAQVDLPGEPDIAAPEVEAEPEDKFPPYLELAYVEDGVKKTVTYKRAEGADEYLAEEEVPEYMPKSLPLEVAPTTFAKKEKK